MFGGSLLALYVHRHHQYRAYGASGGVCGIIFAYLLLLPGASISPFFFPVAIPGWLYALAFLLGSFFALKVGRDNVGHDAHLGGAIIGFVIAAALEPAAVRYNLRVFIAVLGSPWCSWFIYGSIPCSCRGGPFGPVVCGRAGGRRACRRIVANRWYWTRCWKKLPTLGSIVSPRMKRRFWSVCPINSGVAQIPPSPSPA